MCFHSLLEFSSSPVLSLSLMCFPSVLSFLSLSRASEHTMENIYSDCRYIMVYMRVRLGSS